MAAAAAYALSTAFSVGSSMSAKSKAKKEAKKAQRLERLMTAEELRRLDKEQAQVLGTAQSQIAGSGFTGYGASSEAYMADLQKEQGLQRGFTQQVGAQRANAIGSQGRAQAQAYEYQALSSLIGGATKIGESFNWGLE
jgi:hypothetical protein